MTRIPNRVIVAALRCGYCQAIFAGIVSAWGCHAQCPRNCPGKVTEISRQSYEFAAVAEAAWSLERRPRRA